MNKRKKFVSLLLSGALVAGVLAGCSNKEEASGGTKSDEGETITFLIDNQTQLAGIEAVIDGFEEKNNIKVEIETRPGGVEGDNIIKTRLATGDMTDLVWNNSGSQLQALNPEQNFVDLTSEPFMDTIIDGYKEAVSGNGKVFGIPGTPTNAGGWLYNKKVYEELGLTVPTTWDELMANNEKIKEAGKTAVIGTFKDTWTSQVIYLADNYNVLAENPTFAEDFTGNKAKIATTPAALRSFEKLEEVFANGYMNEDFLATGYDAGLKMLADGTGAHYPMITFALANIAANYPDQMQDIGFFPQPSDSADVNGLTVWMPAGIFINKNSEKIDSAKKFLEFYVSQEGIDLYTSVVKPDGPFAIEGVALPEDVYPAVKDMIQYFENGNNAPALEFLSPVKGPNLEQITTQVGSGISTAKEGAELYDKDVEKQAKQLGLEGW
ncbi:ABC transporter substrate-binding protein [Litchfieldia salsa]|uniref:Carbohydrate ABC transporter substrate-binding protein, CUT1 family n=1 Tax=Litchfieldia salsa TaxID=930152 RepID=A0A1H0PYI2_9BACI|nr:extracellular solute-binding protein [Litchfieldia salsa]SDP10251.1 carbohydrate ABC transporter substrate-binding protein, CUT1 family [Litchfieldia salsa]